MHSGASRGAAGPKVGKRFRGVRGAGYGRTDRHSIAGTASGSTNPFCCSPPGGRHAGPSAVWVGNTHTPMSCGLAYAAFRGRPARHARPVPPVPAPLFLPSACRPACSAPRSAAKLIRTGFRRSCRDCVSGRTCVTARPAPRGSASPSPHLHPPYRPIFFPLAAAIYRRRGRSQHRGPPIPF